MNEETNLHEGLEMAVDVLLEESARNELIGAPKSWNAELGGAIAAIRTEHAQRLALQHHACDQAQRIADLETKCCTLKELHDAASDERDALAQQHRSQHDADSAELRQLCADRDAAREERNNLVDAMREEIDEGLRLRELGGALPDENITAMTERLIRQRDELRAKYDELLVALHGIGAALGIPEGDRSPYSVTCGVLERVNRLAVIEAQEPVATFAGPARPSLAICLPEGIRYALPPLVLTGHQIKQALDFVNPDFGSGTDIDVHQMGSTVCIALRGPGEDTDGEPAPAGLYCWLEECPEEGSIMLAAST